MKFLKYFIISAIFLVASSSVIFAQTTEDKTISLKVKGINCEMDVKTISVSIEKLDGVSKCEAGNAGATTTYKISYNPALVTEKDIQAAVENTAGCEDPNDRPYKVKK